MSLETPYKVLCICLGNICRSPTAEVVLRHCCEQAALPVEIDSAGTSNYHPNKAPDLRSQQYARQRGYDLSQLRARQIRLQDFVEFHLILAMDLNNLKDLKQLQQEALIQLGETAKNAELKLMSEYDPNYLGQPVPDPYYGEAEAFELVLDQCESSSRAWVKQLQQQFKQKLGN